MLRASLEQSELSGTGCFAAGKPALSPSVGVTGILARLELEKRKTPRIPRIITDFKSVLIRGIRGVFVFIGWCGDSD